MKAEFVYGIDDLLKLALEIHNQNYGFSPDGYRWKADKYFDEIRITLIQIEEVKEAEEE